MISVYERELPDMFLRSVLLLLVIAVSMQTNVCIAVDKTVPASKIEAAYRNGQVFALWIDTGNIPAVGCGKGKSLCVRLHGRGGGKTAGPKAAPVNYVVFDDSTMGWREGIAFKFYVSITDDFIKIEPYDRTWASRPIMESRNRRDHCPAVNTW